MTTIKIKCPVPEGWFLSYLSHVHTPIFYKGDVHVPVNWAISLQHKDGGGKLCTGTGDTPDEAMRNACMQVLRNWPHFVDPKELPPRYVSAEKAEEDDFGVPFTGYTGELVYDAITKSGRWAMMTKQSFEQYGKGEECLGIGRGQVYMRATDGNLYKIKG